VSRILAIISLLPLAACDSGPSPVAGGVTPDEARALDEAAEMVDAQRIPDEALKVPPKGQARN